MRVSMSVIDAYKRGLQRTPTHLGDDGNDHNLAGADPEGPLAAKVLAENGKHALHRAQNGTVDNHRAALGGEHRAA